MRNSVPSPLLGGSPFPPIAEYGFLSDCETIALVAPSGAIEWLCLPRIDSPSVFGAMLDRDAGSFRLGPSGVSVPAARRYLPGTMVLETSWGTGSGWIIVRDALLIGGWHHEDDRSRHPPPRPHRLRRRPRAAAHDPLRQRPGRDRDGLRAGVRLRHASRSTGSTPARATATASPPRPARTSGWGCAPTCGSGSRARARPPATG